MEITEEEFEARLNHTHMSGISAGLADASQFIMKEALVKFEMGHDEEANMLRTYSVLLMERAEQKHPVAKIDI